MRRERGPDYYEPREPLFDRVISGLLDRLGPRITGALGAVIGLTLFGLGISGILWFGNALLNVQEALPEACSANFPPPSLDCGSLLGDFVSYTLIGGSLVVAILGGVVLLISWRFLTGGDPRDRTP